MKKQEKELKNITGRDLYLEIIPKKIVNGKDTGYYDSKFSVIESNPDLYAFHQKAIDWQAKH